MASGTLTNPPSVVIDATVAIALCAKETDKLANLEAKMKEYAMKGCRFFAPGVIVAECLFVFCRKLKDGVITIAEHGLALQAFIGIIQGRYTTGDAPNHREFAPPPLQMARRE